MLIVQLNNLLQLLPRDRPKYSWTMRVIMCKQYLHFWCAMCTLSDLLCHLYKQYNLHHLYCYWRGNYARQYVLQLLRDNVVFVLRNVFALFFKLSYLYWSRFQLYIMLWFITSAGQLLCASLFIILL